MGVAFAAGDGVGVDLGGPGAGVAGVVGDVDQSVAEFLVGGPAEADAGHLAAGFGDGRDSGQGGEGLLVGEPGAVVADLGEQGRGPDAMAGAGQAGEDVGVGVGVEAFDDLGPELAFLAVDSFDGAQQRQDGNGAALGLLGTDPGRGRVVDPGEQFLDGSAAAVGDPAQERGRSAPG